jgi:hypothetical protein
VLDPEDEGNRILRNLGNTLPNNNTYRSVNAILAQSKNCPFGANSTIELKSVTTTSNNTDTLASQNTPRQMPLLSDVVVLFFSPIVVSIPKMQFFDSATVAFSVQYDALILPNCHNDHVEITGRILSEISWYFKRRIKI